MNIFELVMSNTILKELFLLLVRSLAATLALTLSELANIQNSVDPLKDFGAWVIVFVVTLVATVAGQLSGWLVEKLGQSQ